MQKTRNYKCKIGCNRKTEETARSLSHSANIWLKLTGPYDHHGKLCS